MAPQARSAATQIFTSSLGSSNCVACGAGFDFFGFISIDMMSYGVCRCVLWYLTLVLW
jgi:hypothetical protein